MLRKHSQSLVLLLGLVAACGGDDDVDEDVDGGRVSDASTDGSAADAGRDGSTGDVLQKGTYTVTNPQSSMDGCDMDLDDGSFTEQEFFNNAAGTEISIGTFRSPTTETSWTPAGYALGTGPWLTSRTTTLTVSSHVKFTESGVTCEFDTMRVSNITYTGPNAMTVDFTNNQTNHSAGCATVGYPTANCTSRWTFALSKPLEPRP